MAAARRSKRALRNLFRGYSERCFSSSHHPAVCGPFAKVGFAFRLAKGYVALWAATYFATAILIRVHSVLKVNLYETLPQKSVTERRYGFAAGCEAALGAAVKCGAYPTGYALGAGFAPEVQSFRAKPEPRAQPDL